MQPIWPNDWVAVPHYWAIIGNLSKWTILTGCSNFCSNFDTSNANTCSPRCRIWPRYCNSTSAHNYSQSPCLDLAGTACYWMDSKCYDIIHPLPDVHQIKIWNKYDIHKHCNPCLLFVIGTSHGLSGLKLESTTIVKRWAIWSWSQSYNSNLALLIYTSAHMASNSKPRCGNITHKHPIMVTK